MTPGSVELFADGGVRGGNPGDEVYWSVAWKHDGTTDFFHRESTSQDYNTNNQAEHLAIFHALRAILKMDIPENPPVNIYSDSKLAVNQVTGEWSLKDDTLAKLALRSRDLLEDIRERRTVSVVWKRRKHIAGVLGH